MNKIKFRGHEYETDKIIAGDTVLIEKGEVSIIFDADGNAHEMQPDSVKQYLFTDHRDNEVYDGDFVAWREDKEKNSEFAPTVEADFSMIYAAELFELDEANYEY